jgi:hypothetical protein
MSVAFAILCFVGAGGYAYNAATGWQPARFPLRRGKEPTRLFSASTAAQFALVGLVVLVLRPV